jgi:hypothetical protein
MLGERKCTMRWGGIARLLFAAGLAIAPGHSAGQIRVAQTSIVTNCSRAIELTGRALSGIASDRGGTRRRRAGNEEALCGRASPSP